MQTIYRRVSRPFRARRMERFRRTMEPRPGTRILDVGGTEFNWRLSPGPGQVTLLNLTAPPPDQRDPGFSYAVGDVTALTGEDGAWDICTCNSVIEHLGTWQAQQRAAAGLRRVGRRLWVQTPARAFPVEPHLVGLAIHWLPRRVARRAVRPFTLVGWVNRPTQAQVDGMLDELRLLTRREMEELFPDCEIRVERFLGLPKSYVAVRVAREPAAVPTRPAAARADAVTP
jgi:hypothetical protein